MRIYLSAGFGGREFVREHADELRLIGHEPTSNWLNEPPMLVTAEWENWQLRARANDDAMDISNSEIVVHFTRWPSTSGGRYWELGYGAALGKRLVVIGKRETVFHYMSNVEQYDTWEEFLKALQLEQPPVR